MREPNGTAARDTGNRTETIGAHRYYRICKVLRNLEYVRLSVMDSATLREQAERCRRLAKHADPFTQKRLLDLAAEYDAKIAKLEPQPSIASRIVRSGGPETA